VTNSILLYTLCWTIAAKSLIALGILSQKQRAKFYLCL